MWLVHSNVRTLISSALRALGSWTEGGFVAIMELANISPARIGTGEMYTLLSVTCNLSDSRIADGFCGGMMYRMQSSE